MSASAGDKSPIARLLDKGFYAPLGFVLTKHETVDELAAAGRKQIAFSRSLGRAAIQGLRRSASHASPSASAEVDGYDALSAREITILLADCGAVQARWIQARELAGKQRVTVLRAAEKALA